MGCFSGPEIVNDGLVFHYDMNNNVKSWKGKPVENLVASGQRTCSSGLTRMSYHREAYTYVAGISAHGRKDVIKVTCSPTGTDSIAPYADFGFSVSRSGGSQIGDVYWISFDYKNIRGGDNPSIGIVYANGYKQPDGGNVGTFEPQITVDIENGWKRVSRKCTMTAAGASWWRFGQNSGNEEVEFYLDNFQIIHSDVDAPFVDGTRSNTESLKNIANTTSTITLDSPSYNSTGQFEFNGGTERITLTNIGGSGAFNNHFTISAWINSTNTSLTQNILSMNGPYFMRIVGSKVKYNVYAGSSPSWLFRTGSTTINSNTWYFLTMVWDGTANTWTGYINNTEEFSDSKTGPLAGNTNSKTFFGYVGYTPQGGEQSNFFGQISEVYYYNRALTQEEVKQNFENTRGKYWV